MKALTVNPTKKTLGILEVDEPGIVSPTQVKLHMLEAGVCGTDKEICAFDYGTPPDGCDYLILGHESLGEVVEVGSAVSQLKKGDLIVPTVRRPCHDPHCVACMAGRQDFCYTGNFTERGIKQQHGYMTEYVVDDQKYMNVIPREMRDFAILVEPLTIAEKALIQVWQVQERLPWACEFEPGKPRNACHRALVLGAGPVGLLGSMALANNGFEVFVYSKETVPNPKSQICDTIGAQYISAETETVAQLAARLGHIDLVYEAVGASNLAFEVMSVLGTNGVFVFTGVPGRKAPIEVDTDRLMRNMVLKNQVFFGTVNAGKQAFENAVTDLAEFYRRWPSAVKALITGHFDMKDNAKLLLGQPGGIKNVLKLS